MLSWVPDWSQPQIHDELIKNPWQSGALYNASGEAEAFSETLGEISNKNYVKEALDSGVEIRVQLKWLTFLTH
jgi:hypothetical protein